MCAELDRSASLSLHEQYRFPKILNPVASLMISRGVVANGTINVGLKGTEFTFEVKGRKTNVSKIPRQVLSV